MTRPIPAIVESSLKQQIADVRAAVTALRDAEVKERKADELAAGAREQAAKRRLELGKALAEARKAWPSRGPNARGWGEFLAREGIADSTARRLMAGAGYDENSDGADERPDSPRATRKEPSTPAAPRDPEFSRTADQVSENTPGGSETSDSQTLVAPGSSAPAVTEADVLDLMARLAPDARKRVLKALKPINASGGSGEAARGAYCTPEKYAAAVGRWDLDPFTNPRSHIVSAERCMLEDGGDGIADATVPGSYRCGRDGVVRVATENTSVWVQPDYSFVEEAIAHYGHTRFCALLRFDPSTAWFAELWQRTHAIAIPFGERIEFDPPPGVEASSNPHAHAFYYANPDDVTDEMRALCIVLRVEHHRGPSRTP